MIYYRLKEFFQSRLGQVALLLLAFSVLFFLVAGYLRNKKETEENSVRKLPTRAEKSAWRNSEASNKLTKDDAPEDITMSHPNKNFRPFRPVEPQPYIQETIAPPEPVAEATQEAQPVFPLPSLIQLERPTTAAVDNKSILLPPSKPKLPKPPTLEAEEGTVLYCELTTPTFSDQAGAPVLARLSRPFKRGDKIILPTGTPLSGSLQRTHGSRFFFAPDWRVKLPSGPWVTIKAQTQEAAFDQKSGRYFAHDGRAGLPGLVPPTHRKKKTIWTKALGKVVSAAGRYGQDRTRSVIGEHIPGTARNTVLRGTSDVIEHYTNRPEKNELTHQNPLSVGAGAQFYLVVISD